MAATPEALVKKRIHAALKAVGAYAVNYIGGQYANNGTPDILACLNGRFVGIEAKAGRGKPTALQIKNLRTIADAGGVALVINEKNLDYLKECLDDIRQARSNYQLFAPEETAEPAGTEAD
jgi:Holliday junction resolvase